MSAPEVKPWMRRAADEIDAFEFKPSLEHLAEAIAAHAPPVDEMAEAFLKHPECQCTPGSGCKKADAAAKYAEWLARDGA